jgi:hypothetical protein
MICLDIKNDPTSRRIAVVGCQHGNEVIGRQVYDVIKARQNEFKNLLVIVANTDAYVANKRYIDQDLNRSFPGDPRGNTEERLAAEILPLITEADYVIDLHTTTSPGFDRAAIVGPLDERNKRMIQAFDVNEVAVMETSLLKSSLIGNVRNGVSIEYGLKVAAQEGKADEIVVSILKLQEGEQIPSRRVSTYEVKGVIPLETKTEVPLRNFVYSDELEGYPFIVDEKHYTTMRGFLVVNKRWTHL